MYWLRNRAAKELGNDYGDGDRTHVNDREEYLESLLAEIKPITRKEDIDVCKWVFEQEVLMDLGEKTEAIILNLMGECDNA
ncbi:hypothetical protein [Gibbsiella quercinecans]|uniref:hypothetical protein n=1 Tax=Gibbsiella quercinecans TaxID=929813 RepID=UPI000EF1576A|nr:hypothetical protein [Gibbsiella quercinecans]RLM12141.1 hypothetical protein BIY31_04025 [Gibbsiella quercinecans]